MPEPRFIGMMTPDEFATYRENHDKAKAFQEGKAYVEPFAEFQDTWVGPAPKQITTAAGYKQLQTLVRKNKETRRGFLEEMTDFEVGQVPVVGGFIEAAHSLKIAKTARKINAGENVSDDDLVEFNTYLQFQKRKQNMTKAAKVTDVVQSALSFVAEIAAAILTAGELGAAAVGGAGAKSAGKTGLKKILAEGIERTAKDTVATFAREGAEETAERIAQSVVSKFAKEGSKEAVEAIAKKELRGEGVRNIGKMASKLAESGYLHKNTMAAMKDAVEAKTLSWVSKYVSPKAANRIAKATAVVSTVEANAIALQLMPSQWDNTAKAIADQYVNDAIQNKDTNKLFLVGKGIMDANIELASEFSGEYIGKVAGKFANKAAEAFPGIHKAFTGSAIYQYLAGKLRNTWPAAIRAHVNNVGLNNVIEEMAEERLGGFLRGLFGVNSKAGLVSAVREAIPSWDDFTTEALAFSVLPVGSHVLNYATGGATPEEIKRRSEFMNNFYEQKDIMAVSEKARMDIARATVDAYINERKPIYRDLKGIADIFGTDIRGGFREGLKEHLEYRSQRMMDILASVDKDDSTAAKDKAVADLAEYMGVASSTVWRDMTQADVDKLNAGYKEEKIRKYRTNAGTLYLATDQFLSQDGAVELAQKAGVISSLSDIDNIETYQLAKWDKSTFPAKYASLDERGKNQAGLTIGSRDEKFVREKWDYAYNLVHNTDLLARIPEMSYMLPIIAVGTEAQWKNKGYSVAKGARQYDKTEDGTPRYTKFIRAINRPGKVSTSLWGHNADTAEDVIEALYHAMAGETGKLSNTMESYLTNLKGRLKEMKRTFDQVPPVTQDDKLLRDRLPSIISMLDTASGRLEVASKTLVMQGLGGMHPKAANDYTEANRVFGMLPAMDFAVNELYAIAGEQITNALNLVPEAPVAREVPEGDTSTSPGDNVDAQTAQNAIKQAANAAIEQNKANEAAREVVKEVRNAKLEQKQEGKYPVYDFGTAEKVDEAITKKVKDITEAFKTGTLADYDKKLAAENEKQGLSAIDADLMEASNLADIMAQYNGIDIVLAFDKMGLGLEKLITDIQRMYPSIAEIPISKIFGTDDYEALQKRYQSIVEKNKENPDEAVNSWINGNVLQQKTSDRIIRFIRNAQQRFVAYQEERPEMLDKSKAREKKEVEKLAIDAGKQIFSTTVKMEADLRAMMEAERSDKEPTAFGTAEGAPTVLKTRADQAPYTGPEFAETPVDFHDFIDAMLTARSWDEEILPSWAKYTPTAIAAWVAVDDMFSPHTLSLVANLAHAELKSRGHKDGAKRPRELAEQLYYTQFAVNKMKKEYDSSKTTFIDGKEVPAIGKGLRNLSEEEVVTVGDAHVTKRNKRGIVEPVIEPVSEDEEQENTEDDYGLTQENINPLKGTSRISARDLFDGTANIPRTGAHDASGTIAEQMLAKGGGITMMGTNIAAAMTMPGRLPSKTKSDLFGANATLRVAMYREGMEISDEEFKKRPEVHSLRDDNFGYKTYIETKKNGEKGVQVPEPPAVTWHSYLPVIRQSVGGLMIRDRGTTDVNGLIVVLDQEIDKHYNMAVAKAVHAAITGEEIDTNVKINFTGKVDAFGNPEIEIDTSAIEEQMNEAPYGPHGYSEVDNVAVYVLSPQSFGDTVNEEEVARMVQWAADNGITNLQIAAFDKPSADYKTLEAPAYTNMYLSTVLAMLNSTPTMAPVIEPEVEGVDAIAYADRERLDIAHKIHSLALPAKRGKEREYSLEAAKKDSSIIYVALGDVNGDHVKEYNEAQRRFFLEQEGDISGVKDISEVATMSRQLKQGIILKAYDSNNGNSLYTLVDGAPVVPFNESWKKLYDYAKDHPSLTFHIRLDENTLKQIGVSRMQYLQRAAAIGVAENMRFNEREAEEIAVLLRSGANATSLAEARELPESDDRFIVNQMAGAPVRMSKELKGSYTTEQVRVEEYVLPEEPAGQATEIAEPLSSRSSINYTLNNNPRAVFIGRPFRTMASHGLSESRHFGVPEKLWRSVHHRATSITAKARDLSVAEAYREWLDGDKYQNIEPTRRKWILDNLHQLRGKLLVGEAKDGWTDSHAAVLADKVNAMADVTAKLKVSESVIRSLPPMALETVLTGSAQLNLNSNAEQMIFDTYTDSRNGKTRIDFKASMRKQQIDGAVFFMDHNRSRENAEVWRQWKAASEMSNFPIIVLPSVEELNIWMRDNQIKRLYVGVPSHMKNANLANYAWRTMKNAVSIGNNIEQHTSYGFVHKGDGGVAIAKEWPVNRAYKIPASINQDFLDKHDIDGDSILVGYADGAAQETVDKAVEKIARAANASVDGSIIRQQNYRSSEVERLMSLDSFIGTVQAGRMYTIVTDSLADGLNAMQLRRFIESHGGHVANVLTTGTGGVLAPSKKALKKLESFDTVELKETLNEYGIAQEIEHLSDGAVEIIASYDNIDKLRDVLSAQTARLKGEADLRAHITSEVAPAVAFDNSPQVFPVEKVLTEGQRRDRATRSGIWNEIAPKHMAESKLLEKAIQRDKIDEWFAANPERAYSLMPATASARALMAELSAKLYEANQTVMPTFNTPDEAWSVGIHLLWHAYLGTEKAPPSAIAYLTMMADKFRENPDATIEEIKRDPDGVLSEPYKSRAIAKLEEANLSWNASAGDVELSVSDTIHTDFMPFLETWMYNEGAGIKHVFINLNREVKAATHDMSVWADGLRSKVGMSGKGAKAIPKAQRSEVRNRASLMLRALKHRLDNPNADIIITGKVDTGKKLASGRRIWKGITDLDSIDKILEDWNALAARLNLPKHEEIFAELRAKADWVWSEGGRDKINSLTQNEWIYYIDHYLRHSYQKSKDYDPSQFAIETGADRGPAGARQFPTFEYAAQFGFVPTSEDAISNIVETGKIVWRKARDKYVLNASAIMTDRDGAPVAIPFFEDVSTSSMYDDGILRRQNKNLVDYANSTFRTKLELDPKLTPKQQNTKLVSEISTLLKGDGYKYVKTPQLSGVNGVYVLEGPAENVIRYIDASRWNSKWFSILQNLNHWMKWLSVSVSMFHHIALLESFIAFGGLSLKNPLFHPRQTWDRLKNIKQRLDTDAEYGKFWISQGMQFTRSSPDTDYQSKIDLQLQAGVDSLRKRAAETTSPGVKAVNLHIANGLENLLKAKQMSDQFLWGTLHPVLKIAVAEDMVIRERNRLGRDLTPTEYERIADTADFGLGGLEFEKFMFSNPKTMQGLHMAFFAPDWTMSALGIAGFAGLFGYKYTDLQKDVMFRRYWPAMMGIVLIGVPTAIQATIYMAAGSAGEGDEPFPWMNEKNKKGMIDITPLMRKLPGYSGEPTGKRREYLRLGKQAYEVFDGWLTRFPETLAGKTSHTVKQVVEQTTGRNIYGWDLGFKDKTFLDGLFEGKHGFWDSRIGTFGQHFMPFWASAKLQGRPANMFLPTSRGASQGGLVEGMQQALVAYVEDPKAWDKRAMGVTPKDIAVEFLHAAEINGYHPALIFNTAIKGVQARYQSDLFYAMDRGDTKGMEAAARKLQLLDVTLKNVISSQQWRKIRTGNRLAEAGKQQIIELFSE